MALLLQACDPKCMANQLVRQSFVPDILEMHKACEILRNNKPYETVVVLQKAY